VIAIRGISSTISRELIRLLPRTEYPREVRRGEAMPVNADRYLFCQGLLRNKTGDDQTSDEITEGLNVNAYDVMTACDAVIAANDEARICVMGSESAFKGSYDTVYANAKGILHSYVETKKLRTPSQQLVCVAPTIISDAGMTLRRKDLAELRERRHQHPKRCWLTSVEVARLVYHCLYVDEGYLSGVVIRMNGGEHTRG
jgi:hypothetical protein